MLQNENVLPKTSGDTAENESKISKFLANLATFGKVFSESIRLIQQHAPRRSLSVKEASPNQVWFLAQLGMASFQTGAASDTPRPPLLSLTDEEANEKIN